MSAAERVRAFLREACAGNFALAQLEVSYLKPGPDGPVRLLYEGLGPSGQILRLSARRVRPEDAPKIEAMLARDVHSPGNIAATGFARSVLYAPELQTVFHVFPADRSLPALRTAVDARAMRPILEHALSDATGGAEAARVGVEVVRYKPEQKCSLRYDLVWAGPARPDRPASVYAKIARPRHFARAHETLARLRAAAPEGFLFALPEPLGVVPDLDLALFSRLPGVPLSTLALSEVFPGLCRRAGEALQQFHALPLVLEEQWDTHRKLTRLADNTVEFTWLLGAQRPLIEKLGREIASRLESAACGRLRPIHRDFHGDNLVADGARLGLVDFEDCALGDPADDAGSLWAQLAWQSIKLAGRNSPMPDAGRSAFLEAYLGMAEQGTRERLPAHAAMHCFLYAYQGLRHPRNRARYEEAAALLALCQEVLVRGIR